MWSRRRFVAASTAFAAAWPIEAAATDGPLGHLDHSFWTVANGTAMAAVFRKLGFTLTPKPKVQVDGSLSTFVLFPDSTYLEIVETHTPDEQHWIASGANPEAAGGLVESCTVTARAEVPRGIHMSVGEGAGFCYAAFPSGDSLLSNVFIYGHPSQGAAAKKRMATEDARYGRHENGALGLRESWIAVADIELATARFANAGFPVIKHSIAVEPLAARGTVLAWGAHRIVLLQATGPVGPLGEPVARLGAHPVGVRVAAHMPAARRIVSSIATTWGDALLVGPKEARGGWIAFAPEHSWTGDAT
jgi:hypothetical protein